MHLWTSTHRARARPYARTSSVRSDGCSTQLRSLTTVGPSRIRRSAALGLAARAEVPRQRSAGSTTASPTTSGEHSLRRSSLRSRHMTAGMNDGTAAVSWGTDRIDLFWIDSDDALSHQAFEAGRGDEPESLGGRLASAPAATAWGPDRAPGLSPCSATGRCGTATGTDAPGIRGSRSVASSPAETRRIIVGRRPHRCLGPGTRWHDLAPLVGRHPAGSTWERLPR